MSDSGRERNAIVSRKTPDLSACGGDAGNLTSDQRQQNEERHDGRPCPATRCVQEHLHEGIAGRRLCNCVEVAHRENQGNDHEEAEEGIDVGRPHDGAWHGAAGVRSFLRWEIVSKRPLTSGRCSSAMSSWKLDAATEIHRAGESCSSRIMVALSRSFGVSRRPGAKSPQLVAGSLYLQGKLFSLTHVHLAIKAEQGEHYRIEANQHGQAIGRPPSIVAELSECVGGIVARRESPSRITQFTSAFVLMRLYFSRHPRPREMRGCMDSIEKAAIDWLNVQDDNDHEQASKVDDSQRAFDKR